MDGGDGDDGRPRWSAATVSTSGGNNEIRLDDGRGGGGGGGRYPHVWLRNNCQCPSCASDESGFRKQVIRDFPFRSAPAELQVSTATRRFFACFLFNTLWHIYSADDRLTRFVKLEKKSFVNQRFRLRCVRPLVRTNWKSVHQSSRTSRLQMRVRFDPLAPEFFFVAILTKILLTTSMRKVKQR